MQGLIFFRGKGISGLVALRVTGRPAVLDSRGLPGPRGESSFFNEKRGGFYERTRRVHRVLCVE